PLAILLVFLVLAALYESWTLPLAVILIVPMCMLSALLGVWLAGGDNNVFVQVGLVVVMGLACKNAILIVEFARELELQGRGIVESALEACRLRLRPIVMTSIAFIAGTVPLVLSHGAGAEVRSATGITVFAGMLGVTVFGLFLTPVFYVALRKLVTRNAAPAGAATESVHALHTPPSAHTTAPPQSRPQRPGRPRHRPARQRLRGGPGLREARAPGAAALRARHGCGASADAGLGRQVLASLRRPGAQPAGRGSAARQPRPADRACTLRPGQRAAARGRLRPLPHGDGAGDRQRR